MSKRQLQQITEARASFLYVEHVFTESAKGWASMRDVILNHRKTATDMVARVSHPEAILTIAVLGSNLDSILNYSPVFKDKHEQAARIEEWLLFSLLTEFRDRTPWSPEETLLKVRKYQQLDATLIEELQRTGKNPFGDLTGAFLCDLFGDEVEKLCQAGTNCLDHFLLTLLADLFTITCSSSFSYWKTAYGKYDIVSGGLSIPSGTESTPPATPFTDRLKGKPDGSYVYYDASGKETSGWMPPELLSQVLRESGAQKLTRVLIREPDDTIREDFWPVDDDTVKKLADHDGTVYVMSNLENGKPKYFFIAKRVWDNLDAMLSVMMDSSLSDAQKHARMQNLMKTNAPERTDRRPKTAVPNEQPRGKDLSEKAKDAPIALRILMETIRTRLEREYPQVMLYPRWSAFVLVGTVAGTVGLALRLHYDVAEDQRTSLELAMREVLQKRFPQSEQVYEDCYRFLTDSLMEIPRPERGKHIFVLLGLWVMAAVSEGTKVEKEEWIAGHIAEALQNETAGFWRQLYPDFGL